MTNVLGGTVSRSAHREFGHALVDASPPRREPALCRACRRRCASGPAMATSSAPRRAGFSRRRHAAAARRLRPCEQLERRLYGLLFHPEVVHTEHGARSCANFAFNVCGCTRRLDDGLVHRGGRSARIRARGGGRARSCSGCRGGVDSTVAAMLVHTAIGDRLTCIFVDNGLLRHDEAAARCRAVPRRSCSCRSTVVDATDRSSTRSTASPTRNRSGRSSARRSSTSSSSESERAGAFRFPGPGHALSRRHRERLGGGSRRRHQEPSQRRRPARAHEVRAGGAAARSLQGRSAARSARRSGSSEEFVVAAAVPGPRPGGAHRSVRSRATGWTCCALADAIVSRRDAQGRLLSGSCGRRSRCCCRCRASA